MRIIAGSAKGHVLKVPREVSRPTTDRVRESLFGILAQVVEGAEVLDLYAGSGALSLEALSRGAVHAQLVEQNRGAVRTIEHNAGKLRFEDRLSIAMRDVVDFLRGDQRSYDLIFADPPYADGLRHAAGDLQKLRDWEMRLKPEGYLILEQEAHGEDLELRGLKVSERRRYGKSRLSFYQVA